MDSTNYKMYLVTDNIETEDSFRVEGFNRDSEKMLDITLKMGTPEQIEFSEEMGKRIEEEGVNMEPVYLSTWRYRFEDGN